MGLLCLPDRKIILASGSPRRKALLEREGIEFEITVTGADEETDETRPPEEVVALISRRKAESAVDVCPYADAIIIAADTVVYKDKIFGKPKDRADAIDILTTLQGGWHEVFTGMTIAFVSGERTEFVSDVCRTKVKFKPMTVAQIAEYVDNFAPYDKAGAYAIQDGGPVERIDGDYDNVVGLPVKRLLKIIGKTRSQTPV